LQFGTEQLRSVGSNIAWRMDGGDEPPELMNPPKGCKLVVTYANGGRRMPLCQCPDTNLFV